MSVDLDHIGAELEKLKEEMGVRTLTITYHPTSTVTAYLHYEDEQMSIGRGDSLKEAVIDVLTYRAEWLKENGNV